MRGICSLEHVIGGEFVARALLCGIETSVDLALAEAPFMLMRFASICFAASLVGCGSSENCTVTVPTTCPTTVPSYATDVAPLMTTYCTSCHAVGGQESDIPLTSFIQMSRRSGDIESEVGSCDMPPSDEKQPTDAERAVILDWVICGAKDE
jgi:uncharacterized membrane protein